VVESFSSIEILVIQLLLVVSLVALLVRRMRVPYTVALVLAGLLIAIQREPSIGLSPELILALFVPPLVFEAAFHLEFQQLRRSLIPILLLSVPGVVVTMLIVAGIVTLVGVMPFATGLVFGALISATDPVAVVALFRSLGVPKRLSVIVEGESLFNDGTAIVVFNLVLINALAIGSTGSGPNGSGMTLPSVVISFLYVVAGGLGIGVGLGWLVAWVITRVDDYLIETTLTTVLAFGAYLIGEQMHVSGVLSVVGAGIVCGTLGPRGMSPTTRIVLTHLWEFLAFIANSLVFLLIGLEVRLPTLAARIWPIIVAVLAVIASRALVVYGFAWLSQWLTRRQPIPRSYDHVLFWGGLRGAVSLALALSLPVAFADRALVAEMTFGVVLFTLLVQGTSMQFLLARLGLTPHDEARLAYERQLARLLTARSAREHLKNLHNDGMISAPTWEQLAPDLDQSVVTEQDAQRELLTTQASLFAEELDMARREALRTQRVTLAKLQSDGLISDTVYNELVTEIDSALADDQTTSR
jgi:CPA1 family monovalent cation:H+ antiporter